MVAAGSLMMLPGGVASASGTPKPAKPVCTTLTGDETASTFSGCTPTSAVGTAGTGVTTLDSLTTGTPDTFTATVTWGNGLTTNFGGTLTVIAYTATKNKDKCPAAPAGDTSLAEVKEKGAVTSGGTANVAVGGAVKSTECIYGDPSSPDGTMVDLDGSAKF
jgi:hypothetical protein